MNISIYNQIGHSYLLSRPYVYNGGFFGQILTNFYITDASTYFNFSLNSNLSITNYIICFFFNTTFQVPVFNNSVISYSNASPTNLTTSICGILFALFLFLSCFVAGIIWTCFKLCGTNPKIPDEIIFRSNAEFKKKRIFLFNQILILCIISFCLFLSGFISFLFSLIGQIYLQKQIMDTTTNSSLSSSWVQSSNQLNIFFNRIINDSYSDFNKSLSEMAYGLQSTLNGSLNNLMSDILHATGINSTILSADNLINNIQSVTASMTYILSNTNATVSQINYQIGFCKAVTNLLMKSMLRVCNSLPQSSDCLMFLNSSRNLKVIINPNVINSDSSAAMLFLLNQLKLNITFISIQFLTLQSNLNNAILLQTSKKVQALNLQNSVNKINTIWPYILQTFNPLKNTFSSIKTSTSTGLNSFGLTIFIIYSILLFFIGISILIYILVLYRYSYLYYIQKQILLNHIQNIFLKRLHIQEKYQIINQNTGIRNCVIYCYIVTFSFVISIILFLSLCFINGSHLLYNELCVQIWRSEGLSISDSFLDTFFNSHWNSIISYILSTNSPIQFTFPKPTKVLTSIRNNCINNTGIFNALQMINFVNVSSFLWTPQNMNTLLDGANLTYTLVMGINIPKVIPKNTITLLNSALAFSGYFDNINYQPTINELSKGVLQMKNYSSWIPSAIEYFSTINTPDANETIGLLNYMNADLPQLQGLELLIINLRNNFQIIQNGRTISLNINAFLANITSLIPKLSNTTYTSTLVQSVYSQRMLTEFPLYAEYILNELVDSMIKQLFPCDNLANSVNILLNNLCDSDATLEKTNSYALNVSVFCGLFIFMLHFLWIIVRKDRNYKNESNVSMC